MIVQVDKNFHEHVRYEVLQDLNVRDLADDATIKSAAFYERTLTGAKFVVVTEDSQIVLYEVSVVGHIIGGSVTPERKEVIG